MKPVEIPALDNPCEEALLQMELIFAGTVKPLLAVGLSAIRMNLGDSIIKVAEKHKIPVIFTPMAKGLMREDHPSYAGVLFHALSDHVAETHKQADLIVGVGYDPVEFNYEEWMPEVPLIHIDPAVADIDRNSYPDVLDVTGHPGGALIRLENLEAISSEWDFDQLEQRRNAMFEKFVPKGTGFGPLAALAVLREVLPEDGIMTCDVGSHTHLIGQAWRTPHPYGQIMTNGWSSMGFGVPAAIAAKIACPERPVVCVTGDGGFMMMAGEMATARRLGQNTVFVILADRKLGLIRIKQSRRGVVTEDTLLSDQDIPSSEHIFGVPVLSVSDTESYRNALEKAFQADGPVIIEAVIDSSEYDDLILKKHK
jgi:acetolactate synthase-1/2/3 large subunit